MAEPVPARPYAALVVFALGTVFGAALTVILLHLPSGTPLPFHGHEGAMRGPHGQGPETEAVIDHMERELGLDDAQRAKVREILDDAHGRIHQTLEETHRKIRELLTPDQQKRFDAMRPPDLPFPHRGGAAPPP